MYEDLKGKTALVTGGGGEEDGYRLRDCRTPGRRVAGGDPAALEAAFASGRTACINVAVDPSVISPGSVAPANLGGYRK